MEYSCSFVRSTYRALILSSYTEIMNKSKAGVLLKIMSGINACLHLGKCRVISTINDSV